MSVRAQSHRERMKDLLGELKGLATLVEAEISQAETRDDDPPARAVEGSDAAALAAYIHKARRHRDRFFDPTLFSDPAWDMLLELFATAARGRDASVAGLCAAAAVPPATALRWIERLEAKGMVSREPAADGGPSLVRLTPASEERLERYLAEISPY